MSRAQQHLFLLVGAGAIGAALLAACGGDEPEPAVAKAPVAVSSSAAPSASIVTPPPPAEPTLDERRAKAKAAYAANDLATAKAEVQAIIGKKADDVFANRLLGDIETKQGNYPAATDAYFAASKADGGKDEGLALAALDGLRKAKRWDDAIQLAQLAAKGNDKSMPLWLNLGLAQQHKGDDAAAVETFTKMTTAFPDEPELWARLALAEALAGKKDEAKKSAKMGVERWSEARDPKKKKDVKLGAGPEEIGMLARAYRRAGDPNDALATLAKYKVGKDETATELEIEKGFALRAKKDLRGAEAQVKKALAAGGDGYAPAHLLQAGIALDQKKMDDAKKQLAEYKAHVAEGTAMWWADSRDIEAAIK